MSKATTETSSSQKLLINHLLDAVIREDTSQIPTAISTLPTSHITEIIGQALILACEERKLASVKALLAQRDSSTGKLLANINATDLNGNNGLFIILEKVRTHPSQEAHYFEIFKELLNHTDELNINAQNPSNLNTALHFACFNKLDAFALELLRHPKTDIKLENSNKDTPLMAAAEKGLREVVAILLERIDSAERNDYVNARNNNDYSAVKLAINSEKAEIVRELLHYLPKEQLQKLLLSVIFEGKKELVEVFVNHPDVDLNMPGNAQKDTALMAACNKGHLEVVKLLLSLKDAAENPRININAANKNGDTALIMAAWAKHFNVVEELLNNNAININQTNLHGRTPLMTAIIKNAPPAIIAKFLEQGADPNIKDDAGESAVGFILYEKIVDEKSEYENSEYENLLKILINSGKVDPEALAKEGQEKHKDSNPKLYFTYLKTAALCSQHPGASKKPLFKLAELLDQKSHAYTNGAITAIEAREIIEKAAEAGHPVLLNKVVNKQLSEGNYEAATAYLAKTAASSEGIEKLKWVNALQAIKAETGAKIVTALTLEQIMAKFTILKVATNGSKKTAISALAERVTVEVAKLALKRAELEGTNQEGISPAIKDYAKQIIGYPKVNNLILEGGELYDAIHTLINNMGQGTKASPKKASPQASLPAKVKLLQSKLDALKSLCEQEMASSDWKIIKDFTSKMVKLNAKLAMSHKSSILDIRFFADSDSGSDSDASSGAAVMPVPAASIDLSTIDVSNFSPELLKLYVEHKNKTSPSAKSFCERVTKTLEEKAGSLSVSKYAAKKQAAKLTKLLENHANEAHIPQIRAIKQAQKTGVASIFIIKFISQSQDPLFKVLASELDSLHGDDRTTVVGSEVATSVDGGGASTADYDVANTEDLEGFDELEVGLVTLGEEDEESESDEEVSPAHAGKINPDWLRIFIRNHETIIRKIINKDDDIDINKILDLFRGYGDRFEVTETASGYLILDNEVCRAAVTRGVDPMKTGASIHREHASEKGFKGSMPIFIGKLREFLANVGILEHIEGGDFAEEFETEVGLDATTQGAASAAGAGAGASAGVSYEDYGGPDFAGAAEHHTDW